MAEGFKRLHRLNVLFRMLLELFFVQFIIAHINLITELALFWLPVEVKKLGFSPKF